MRVRVVVPLLLLNVVVLVTAIVRSSITHPGVVSGSTTDQPSSTSSTTTLPWGAGIGVLPVIQVFPVVPADNRLRPAAIYRQRVDLEGLWLPELIVVIP